MVATAKANTSIFAVDDVVQWDDHIIDICARLPTGFITDHVAKVGNGPFVVEKVVAAIELFPDKEFVHPQIVSIKNLDGTPINVSCDFSGVYFKKSVVQDAAA